MRSKHVSTSLACMLFLLTISAAAQFIPIRVACVGNSITFGGLGDQSYPQQLGKLLSDHYVVKNFGVSGTTLLKKGDFPYWNESAFLNAQDFEPHILILCLGTNDSKPQNWVYKDEFLSDYRAMIQVFRDKNPNIHIFACSPPPVFRDGYGITNSIIRDEIIPIVKQIRQIAKVDSIDFYQRMLDQGALFSDGIHPDAAGYTVMANVALEAINNSASGIIRYFNVHPAFFEMDNACILYWETTNQSQTAIEGVSVPDSDSLIVHPTTSMSYTLITHGLVMDTAVVAVTYLPPGRIKSFTASVEYLDQGSSDQTTLQWSATNGSSVILEGQSVAVTGWQNAAPSQTTTYTLTAAGGESDTARVTVHVLPSDQINRALDRPVQVSASERGNTPAWAVDGDSTTSWKSGLSGTQWINVDLGAMHDIHRIVVHWGKFYGMVYHVQAMDEAGKTVTLYSNTKGDGGVDDIAELKGSGRHLRLLCITKSKSDSAMVLKELQVYGTKWFTGVEKLSGPIAHDYELAHNYPNPFNPTTRLTWRIAIGGHTKLIIFDLLGREVKILINEHLPAGSYQIDFDAVGLAAGVYYCHLESGSFATSRKMVLLH